VEEALDAYLHALHESPFLFEARDEMARLALDTARPEDALPLLDDWIVIAAGCPVYASTQSGFEALLTQAQQMRRQKSPENGPALRRFLAFPEWDDPAHWQAIVGAFAAAYRSEDPALLMLTADPARYPDALSLLRSLQTYLVCQLHLDETALPNIT